MFEVLVDVVSPLFVTVIGGAILALLLYIGGSLKKIVDIVDNISNKQEKTDRVLYGDECINDGLVKMVMEIKREIEKLRLLQMELINKLRKEDIIDYDDDVKDLCYKLNQSD